MPIDLIGSFVLQCRLTEIALESGNFSHWRWHLKFVKPYQMVKSEKYETFHVSKRPIWRQKWVTRVRLVVRRVSPGRVIVVLF